MSILALFYRLSLDQIILIRFGLMCSAVIAAAHTAPEEREQLRFAAIAVGVNWLLFASYWIYAPISPAFLVYGSGKAIGLTIAVRHEDMWALSDLLCLMIVGLRCRFQWWGPLVWGMWIGMLAILSVEWANGLEYLDIKPMLDASLVTQLLALLALSLFGGKGCADRLFDLRDRFRRLGLGPGRNGLGNAEASS
jgi:hypothetical protein